MAYYLGNLDKESETNHNYRKVILTTSNFQLVFMRLKPEGEIPWEIHAHTDQYFHIVKGTATIDIENEDHTYKLKEGDSFLISSNTRHLVKNIEKEDLILYTIYTPPQHPPNRVDV